MRRLSEAGFDIYKSNSKIIDIALKYQYENPTSFSRAFEKFHGIKPSQVKSHPEKLKVYTKIVFNEQLINGEDMIFNIECAIKNKMYKIVNCSFYRYRINMSSVTNNFKEKMILNLYF